MLSLDYEKRVSLMNDDIGKAIIGKIIKKKIIKISDLPLDRTPSILTLERLYKLLDEKLLESKFEENGEKYERVFYPSDRLVKIIEVISQ